MDSLPSLASVSGLVHFTQYLKWGETVAAKRVGLKRSTDSKAAPFENNNTSMKSAVQIGRRGVSPRLSASSSSFGGAGRSGRRVLSSAGRVRDLDSAVNSSTKTCSSRGLFVFELFPSLRALGQRRDTSMRCDGLNADLSPADLKWAREVCDALSDGVALLYLAVSLASSSAKPREEFDSSTNAANRRGSSFWYGSAISTSLAEWCLGSEAVKSGSFSQEGGHNNGPTRRERTVSVLVALEAEVSRLSSTLLIKSKCAHNSSYSRDVVLPSSGYRSPSRVAKGTGQTTVKQKGRGVNEGQLCLASRIFSGNFEAISYALHVLFMAYVGKERLDRIPQMLSWYADLADGGYGLSTFGLSIIAKGSEFCRSVGAGEGSTTPSSVSSSGLRTWEEERYPLKRIASIFADGTLWLLALDNVLRTRSLFARYERVGELENERNLGTGHRSKTSGNVKSGHEASSVNDSSNDSTSFTFVTASGLDLSQVYLCPMSVDERCHNMRLWGLAMRKLGVYSYFDFFSDFAGQTEAMESNQKARLPISAIAPTPLFLLLQSFFIYNFVRHTSLALCGKGSLAGRKIVNEIVVRRRMLRVGRAAAAGGFGVNGVDSGDEALEEGVVCDSQKSIRELFNEGIYPQLHSAVCELRIPSIVSTTPRDVAEDISLDHSLHCSLQYETERREDITFNVASLQKKDVQQLPTVTRGRSVHSSLVESCERQEGSSDSSRVCVVPSIDHEFPIPQQSERVRCEGEMLEKLANSEEEHTDAQIHVWSFSLRKNDKKTTDFATASRKNSEAETDMRGPDNLQLEGRSPVRWLSSSPRGARQSDSSNCKKPSAGCPPSIYSSRKIPRSSNDRVINGSSVGAKKDKGSTRIDGKKPLVAHIHIDPLAPSSSVEGTQAEAAMFENSRVPLLGKRGHSFDRRASPGNAVGENHVGDDGLELQIEEAASEGEGERQSQPLKRRHSSGGSAHGEGTVYGATHLDAFTSREGLGGRGRQFRDPSPKDMLREAFDTRATYQMNCNNPHRSLFVVDLN